MVVNLVFWYVNIEKNEKGMSDIGSGCECVKQRTDS